MSEYVVELKHITKRFPGVVALKDMSIGIRPGEIHGLIGENGAGKSTLIKVLTGVHTPEEGEIFVDGQKVVFKNPVQSREAGIACVYQELNIVKQLPVTDNVFMGRAVKKGLLLDYPRMHAEAEEALKTLGHPEINVHLECGKLGVGQQQMVEIVKAVSFNGKIIVMDEPTSSLSNEEVEQLFEIIENLRKKKVSIIYISHRMEELFRISDRVTVIRDGAYVGTKKTSETSPNELVAMMVGRDLESFYARDYCDMDKAETALEVRNLSQTGVFEDISFSVHKGEILGFSGLVGAGRSEIMEAIFGATRLTSGEVILGGKPVHFKNPMQAIKAGIALVPEDRKKQGLVLGNSVAFNLTLSSLRFYMNGIAISERKRGEVIDHYSQRLRIKAASPEIEAGSLSGGNQQKVVLGKWLATKPDVLILDEPTRGVDVNAKFEIYTVINELAKEGIAIIMVSSELPEIINMCDNVCVVRAGRLVKKLSKDELSQEEIMKYAAGGIE